MNSGLSGINIAKIANDHFLAMSLKYTEVREYMHEMRNEAALTKTAVETRKAVLGSRYFVKQIPELIAYNIAGSGFISALSQHQQKQYKVELRKLLACLYDEISKQPAQIPAHKIEEAKEFLEKAGYVVLSEKEYESINASN